MIDYIEPPAVDWQSLIQRIVDAGVSRKKITVLCRVGRTTVHTLSAGKSNPSYTTGSRIMALAVSLGVDKEPVRRFKFASLDAYLREFGT